MKKFYGEVNDYGSESDTGFANTWRVLAFSSQSARDAWLREVSPKNRTARVRLRQDLVKEYRLDRVNFPQPVYENAPDGCVGTFTQHSVPYYT